MTYSREVNSNKLKTVQSKHLLLHIDGRGCEIKLLCGLSNSLYSLSDASPRCYSSVSEPPAKPLIPKPLSELFYDQAIL